MFGEVAIIVVGVLIALGAQQLVESWSWRQKVAAAEQTMNEEIRNSLLAVVELDQIEHCTSAQAEALQDAIVRGDQVTARHILRDGSPFGFSRLWADNAFQATLAAQVSDHLGAEKLKQYSQVYQMIRDIRRTKDISEEASPELAVLFFVPDLPTSPERRYAQLREVTAVRLQRLAMRVSGEPLVRYARNDLGLEVTQRDYLAAPGRAKLLTQCKASAAAAKASLSSS